MPLLNSFVAQIRYYWASNDVTLEVVRRPYEVFERRSLGIQPSLLMEDRMRTDKREN
jgi:hypothetical protein